MNPATDLVNRLWRLCALLRKDGVTYQQYVTELTYLLFLKMASEQKDESCIPEKYRWGALKSASETEVLQRYRQALIDLGDGTKIADRSVVAIFQNAATIVREPANLRKRTPSTAYTGSARSAMPSVTPMRVCYRRWRKKPSAARGNISPRAC